MRAACKGAPIAVWVECGAAAPRAPSHALQVSSGAEFLAAQGCTPAGLCRVAGK